MSSMDDARVKMEQKLAEMEIQGFATEAQALIGVMSVAIGMQDALPKLPGYPKNTRFMFMAAGLHTEPGTTVDALVMQSGVAYTCDGEIVGWPVDGAKGDTRPRLDIVRSIDYRPGLTDYIRNHPGAVSDTVKQAREYADSLYGYIERVMGPAAAGAAR